MKIKQINLFILISLLFSSCATICKVDSFSTIVKEKEITINDSEIPCWKVDDFKKASELTIKAIFSQELEERLSEHIKDSIGVGKHAIAWENLTSSKIVEDMRNQINGTYVTTYGGIKGFFLNKFAGNIAYDGTENGPIRFNRIPLKKRTVPEISNTIGHEVAHRIGLHHPSSKKDLKTARKEPPYVIGDLIEVIVNELLEKNP